MKALIPFAQRRILLALLALAVLPSRAFATSILYTQPAQSPVQSVRASQDFGPPLGLFFQTFDDFSLSQTGSISEVDWQGSYANFLVPDPSFNPPANSTGFGIAFYDDSSGSPGALLASYAFTPAGAGETFVTQQTSTFNPLLGLGVYSYQASLGSPFVAQAGTTYWLSVYAFSPLPSATQAQWGWNGGTGGNGSSLQVQAGVGSPLVPVTPDRALTLSGTPVPEPSTLLLLGTGLFGLARRLRRQRRVP